MSMFVTPESSLKEINFKINDHRANVEVKGNLAFVYIDHKKITLRVQSNSLSNIENYLNSNKEKIIHLLRQHELIEGVYNQKNILLLDGGRFQYFTDKGQLKTTTLQEEYVRLEKKASSGFETKWNEKLERIREALRETKIIDREKSKPIHSTAKASFEWIEQDPKYSDLPLKVDHVPVRRDFPLQEINENHRRTVRTKTKRRMDTRVIKSSGLLFGPKKRQVEKTLEEVRLYHPSESQEPQRKTLLEDFEILQVPIKMDFDQTWTPLYYNKKDGTQWYPEQITRVDKVRWDKGSREKKLFPGKKLSYHKPSISEYRPPKNSFYCHYASPLQAAETKRYFFEDGHFDEERYLEDAGALFYSALSAQKESGAKEILWNSFGMESSLRMLPKKESNYRESGKMGELRYKLALKFREQFENPKFKDLQLHLCLSTGKGWNIKKSWRREAIENHNAFVSAFSSASPNIRKRVTFHQNTDMPVLAQELAEKRGEGKVSMIQQANPHTLGNNWLENPALDNLHCRSSSAATIACVLDQGIGKKARTENLKERIEKFGGRIVVLQ